MDKRRAHNLLYEVARSMGFNVDTQKIPHRQNASKGYFVWHVENGQRGYLGNDPCLALQYLWTLKFNTGAFEHVT